MAWDLERFEKPMIRKIIISISNIYKTVNQILFGEEILIYQMAKVGSTSLEKSLKERNIPVKHLHSYAGTLNYNFNESITMVSKLKKPLYKLCFKLRKKELIVITFMRDPMARNISALFQSLYIMIYMHHITDNKKEENLYDMLNLFLDKYVNTDIPLTWFDKEIKEYLGIDIFDYNFDKDSGTAVITKDNIKLLVLTTEKLNENTLIIGDFLEVKDLKLNTTNISSNKWYSDIYKKYIREFDISQAQIKYFYESAVVEHFYSDSDIQKFIDKWSKKSIEK